LEEPGLQPLDTNEARREQNQPPKLTVRENQENHRPSPVPVLNNNFGGNGKIENNMIDLNTRPQRVYGQASTNQVYVLPISILVCSSSWGHYSAFLELFML
jgi:hypothetical protein